MGRPSKFKPGYCEQAETLCREGATDAVLAARLGVAESTINKWKLEFPEFSDALKRGKPTADDKVESSLFRRACGFEHDGKYYPPDTTAAIFWLKNRRSDEWRDKQQQEITGLDGGPLQTTSMDLSRLNDEQLDSLSNLLTAASGRPGGD